MGPKSVTSNIIKVNNQRVQWLQQYDKHLWVVRVGRTYEMKLIEKKIKSSRVMTAYMSSEMFFFFFYHVHSTRKQLWSTNAKLDHHWFRWWLAECLLPISYLNQSWLIVNCAYRNALQLNLYRSIIIFIQASGFGNIARKVVAILRRLQCLGGILLAIPKATIEFCLWMGVNTHVLKHSFMLVERV